MSPGQEGRTSREFVALHIPSRGDMRLTAAGRWREWMNATQDRFANRCLPLLLANEAGWTVHNPLPFEAVWNGGDRNEISLEFSEEPPPGASPLVLSHFGYGILTWRVPYLFRTPPGWNLLVRGPANAPKDGAAPLEGLVETDWSVATFTMNWKLTRPNHPVRFEADEPFCMVVPQRRGELESFDPVIRGIDSEPEIQGRFKRWESRRELTKFAKVYAERKGSDSTAREMWDKDYFKGASPDGAEAPVHQTKLHLSDFETSQDDLRSGADERGRGPTTPR